MKYFAFLLILMTSCKLDRDKTVDREKFSFKTGDDTELFFKNVRQSYYDLEENKVAKMNVFRYEDRIKEAGHPLLNLAIVVNYTRDEAYLLVEPNEMLRDQDKVKIFWKAEQNQQGEIILENYNREGMLEFASQVYEAMLKRAGFKVEIHGAKVPVLQDPTEREAFRITVADYYRLTRIY
ncbi:hypothetical protein C900_00795 [Fulvivirga imtechensis AK7]|uniref:Uncharacterized protein n=1 Tax=Fulvivirga imtechensis AK7 TaxID=1237149 RepID=L8JYX0_9BACT|nr:hypothetical protein [Fulvivirga imtechensis]ELR72834.1 hypothetical protein C900_00795 [Fulvivirga imtechensis AK7]